MNYFKYQSQVPMGRIWGLFTQLANMSEEEILKKDRGNYSCSYAHTLDIVKAAISGSLTADADSFCLKAYEITCDKNDANKLRKDAKEKEVFIVFESSEDVGEDKRVGYGDISERKLNLKHIESAFEAVDSLESFEENINELLNIRNTYIKTKGIDLVSILRNALKGIPEASQLLSKLVADNKDLLGLITSLCEDSEEGRLLNRLATI